MTIINCDTLTVFCDCVVLFAKQQRSPHTGLLTTINNRQLRGTLCKNNTQGTESSEPGTAGTCALGNADEEDNRNRSLHKKKMQCKRDASEDASEFCSMESRVQKRQSTPTASSRRLQYVSNSRGHNKKRMAEEKFIIEYGQLSCFRQVLVIMI